MLQADAERTLQELNCQVGETHYDHSCTIPAGKVVDMSGASYAIPGSVVHLTVSLGPYAWEENSGQGTQEHPYIVETVGQMMCLAQQSEYWDRHFLLNSDINLSTWSAARSVLAPDNNDVEPGFQGIPFTGRFGGQGHCLDGLNVVSASEYAGWVGKAGETARIQNLKVTNALVIGRIRTEVSSIDSRNSSGPRGRCSAGLIVADSDGQIGMCYSAGLVMGTLTVGGLVGKMAGAYNAAIRMRVSRAYPRWAA